MGACGSVILRVYLVLDYRIVEVGQAAAKAKCGGPSATPSAPVGMTIILGG
jgi:hypothetical protein